VNTYQVMI